MILQREYKMFNSVDYSGSFIVSFEMRMKSRKEKNLGHDVNPFSKSLHSVPRRTWNSHF